jgi:hypothetical protein
MPEVINAIPECPEESTLIAESREFGILFYRLPTCQFYLRAPTGETNKWYIIVFDELNENTYYYSFEEFIPPKT